MAILNIPVTKAGKTIPVNTETDLPDDMYTLALEEGLKVLLNKRMSKITTKGLEGDQLSGAKDAAMKVATENFEMLKASKVRKGRAGAKSADGAKIPGVVVTEARRLAKEVVKNEIRAAGMKISHVAASDITKAANELLASDPSYYETAQANIEARQSKPVAVDIKSLIHESPKLVQKSEQAKAERKQTLSAKQAGKVAPRKGDQARAIPASSLQ